MVSMLVTSSTRSSSFRLSSALGGGRGGGLGRYTYLRRLRLLPFFLSHDLLLLQHMVGNLWVHPDVLHQTELVGRVGVVGDLLVLVLDHCYYACHPAQVVLQQPLERLARYFPN